MAAMPNEFWSGWIIVLTVVSMLALLWLVIAVYFPTSPEHHQDKEPVWDQDLREGSNAPPMWWFWLVLASMVFSVVYLMLYPGLGAYKGMLNWSLESRLETSYENYEQLFAQRRAAILSTDLIVLGQDPVLMNTAEHLFARECAVCHGADGEGQLSLFPNLRDDDWQWGASAEQIEQTIRGGRSASMVSWKAILNEDAINQIADYVLLLGTERGEGHNGQNQFNQYCSACHGVDGAGNPILGAPNLEDDTWLYGGEVSQIRTSISEGRNGEMPSFSGRLDDTQIKLLVAWLKP